MIIHDGSVSILKDEELASAALEAENNFKLNPKESRMMIQKQLKKTIQLQLSSKAGRGIEDTV